MYLIGHKNTACRQEESYFKTINAKASEGQSVVAGSSAELSSCVDRRQNLERSLHLSCIRHIPPKS